MTGPRADPRSILRAMGRLRDQLCALPSRVARAFASVRDTARRMLATAVAKDEAKGSRESSHASRSGSNLMPILLSLNIVLLAVTIAMLLLQ
jgi:hypothetical protein